MVKWPRRRKTAADYVAEDARRTLVWQLKQQLQADHGLTGIRVYHRNAKQITFTGNGPDGYRTYIYDVATGKLHEPHYITPEAYERRQQEGGAL